MARRERNIYKRGDGRWEGRYIKDYGGAGGRARYSSVYGKSYSEAKKKLEQVKAFKPPANGGAISQTVREAVESHLVRASAQIKKSTRGLYERYLDGYIGPYFGKTRCCKLSQKMLQDFVDRQTERGLAAVTVQSVFSLLRLSVKGLTGLDFSAVRLPKRFNTEAAVFSRDEQKRLENVSAVSGGIDGIAIKLALYTGLRIGELCGLMWGDVDFERKLLYVRRTAQRIKSDGGKRKTELVFLTPKSQTSERVIPLTDSLIRFLAEYRKPEDSACVISRGGNPVEPRVVQYRFKRLLGAAGLRNVNFHTTRHTFATRALESGCDIKALSEIMGHASATMTLNRYAHVLDDRKRAHMEALAAMCV
jgi:integrase